MKPLNIILLFLVLIIPIVIGADARQTFNKNNATQQEAYAADFQSAVDDTAAYLGRFESQQGSTAIRYQKEKNINTDMDMLNVFFSNLALKYGVENNPVEQENLKMHMPGMVIFRYDGYVLVTLEDSTTGAGKKLTPVLWPTRPYVYKLANGNLLYYNLDDQAKVYDIQNNEFYDGDYDSLSYQTDLSPLTDIQKFRENRQITIVNVVEDDLSAVVNRHNETVKRSSLSIQFTVPTVDQSITDVGFMAFVQGYPLPGGQTLNAYAFGGGSVVQRKAYIGTVDNNGKHIAYPELCTPINNTQLEKFYDPDEAVRKGYFIADCDF